MATKRKSTKRKATTHKRKVGAVRHTTKRHHVAKRRTSSRSKMGAIGQTGEILLGAVAGSIVTRIIEKNLPAPKDANSTDLRPYTGLVVGAAAEFFGKKNLLVRSMGIGAIVEGARAIVQDKYIPSFNSAMKTKGGSTTNGLPYTMGTVHVSQKRMNRMKMKGLQNALAGSPAALASSRGLAGTNGNVGFYGYYDGL